MFKIVRNVFKFGDAFLLEIRKQKMVLVDPKSSTLLLMNQKVKKPTIYCERY